MNKNTANVNALCRSIGLIYDRTTSGGDPICSTFLVSDKKSASLASLLLPFAQTPEALRVSFPSTEREFGVKAIHPHPKFDRGLTRKTLFQGTLGNAPESALQKYNCCILELGDKVHSVTEMQIEQVSQSLRYPLNLSDDGFRGSLKEIELPLVIQTLNNAKKQGILYICDDMHRPVAQIFCQGGKIVAAKYGSLLNELAMFQIIEKRLTGRFIFRACKPPAWMPANTITMSTDTILIEAMRRQDEIANFQKQLGTTDYFFVRAYKQLYLDGISPANRRYVEMVWRALDGTTPADQLWCLVPLDDYTIILALYEMYSSNQCMRVPLAGTLQFSIPKMPDDAYAPAFVSATALPLGTSMPLKANDTISSISIDAVSFKPRVKVGALLGAIDPYDAVHLLHDIPLLPWASGSPIVKDDLVIGMHCGVVPSSSAVDNTYGVLQQMLWCEAIEQTLKQLPAATAVAPVPPAGAAKSPAAPASNDPASPQDSGSVPEPGASSGAAPLASSASPAGAQPKGAQPAAAEGATKILPAAATAQPMVGADYASEDTLQFDSKKRRPLQGPLLNGPPGCREIASLKCAVCGERTFSSARRCTRCSNEFVPQLRRENKRSTLDLALPFAAIVVVALAVSAAYAWTRLPAPSFQNFNAMSVPAKPWVKLSIMKGVSTIAQGAAAKWIELPSGANLGNRDTMHFRMTASKSCYVYLLYKGTGSTKAEKCYPSGDSKEVSEGESVTYPERTSVIQNGQIILTGMGISGPAGSDEVIALASSPYPLNWLENANNADDAFKKAEAALSFSKGGVLLSEAQIRPTSAGDNQKAGSKEPSNTISDPNELVYVTAAFVKH